MRRNEFNDLNAFVVVAEEQSFTKAAAKLLISQSALSHAVKRLETNLGLRLLTRTTRSVSLTEAGERLYNTLNQAFQDINNELDSLSNLQETPGGTIRLNSHQHASNYFLWPKIEKFIQEYPDVGIEILNNSAFVDIVSERFDAGIRLGESLEKDMVSVRISDDIRMCVVVSPTYLAENPAPLVPQDLEKHSCINLRMATLGGLYVWEFEKASETLNVRVSGNLVFNDTSLIIKAALAGFGLAYIFTEHTKEFIKKGELVEVLSDWTPPFSGYHLYYPSRKQHTQAFKLLIDMLRFKKK